jgi:hypothetical protein
VKQVSEEDKDVEDDDTKRVSNEWIVLEHGSSTSDTIAISRCNGCSRSLGRIKTLCHVRVAGKMRMLGFGFVVCCVVLVLFLMLQLARYRLSGF